MRLVLVKYCIITCRFVQTLVVILELGLRVPQELSRLEVVARLDAAVVAAEEAAGAVVLLPRVPARVALVRALVLREGWRVGALARICTLCFTD